VATTKLHARIELSIRRALDKVAELHDRHSKQTTLGDASGAKAAKGGSSDK